MLRHLIPLFALGLLFAEPAGAQDGLGADGPSAAVMRQLDRNADGVLSRREVREPRALERADRNNDGVLDRDELGLELRSDPPPARSPILASGSASPEPVSVPVPPASATAP